MVCIPQKLLDRYPEAAQEAALAGLLGVYETCKGFGMECEVLNPKPQPAMLKVMAPSDWDQGRADAFGARVEMVLREAEFVDSFRDDDGRLILLFEQAE